jgi:hypothetical protein
MTGILKVSNGESRIDGTLLGRKGSGDPYGAATAFLEDHDCHDSDCVTVTGTQEADAFYIDSAVKEETSMCQKESAVLVGEDLSKGKVQREAVQPSSKKKATKSAKGKGTKKASGPPTKQRVSRRTRKKKKTAAGKGRRGRTK